MSGWQKTVCFVIFHSYGPGYYPATFKIPESFVYFCLPNVDVPKLDGDVIAEDFGSVVDLYRGIDCATKRTAAVGRR